MMNHRTSRHYCYYIYRFKHTFYTFIEIISFIYSLFLLIMIPVYYISQLLSVLDEVLTFTNPVIHLVLYNSTPSKHSFTEGSISWYYVNLTFLAKTI